MELVLTFIYFIGIAYLLPVVILIGGFLLLAFIIIGIINQLRKP